MTHLLHKNNNLTFLLLLVLLSGEHNMQGQNEIRVVCWNVENLFDVWDDSTRSDEAFTPEGDYHWTYSRYRTKLTHLSQTLVALGDRGGGRLSMPVVVGLVEVENDKVLRDLCRGTPLRRHRYQYIHFDSPDRRGIDNALLYRSGRYTPYHAQVHGVSDSSQQFFTRDILHVEGVTSGGDTLIFLVNHFPSKRGGQTADRHRERIARQLRQLMDSLVAVHPGAGVVVMGDFNADPSESVIRYDLMRHGRRGNDAFVNLMKPVAPGEGSYKYRDYWSCIDQMIVSRNLMDGPFPLRLADTVGHIFAAPFLLVDDEKFLDPKLFRTYLGMRYQGGYSDHLPVYIDLKRR